MLFEGQKLLPICGLQQPSLYLALFLLYVLHFKNH